MRPSFLNEDASTAPAGKLNVKTKLAVCLLSSLSAMGLSNPQALALLAVVSTIYALCAMTPLTLVKTYCFVAFMLVMSLMFTALLSLVMPKLIKWEIWRFTVPYLRMLVSLNALFALAFSTRIQDVLRELKAFARFAWIQVPLTVAIRFLPTFLDDCGQIMDAYRLRRPLGKTGVCARITALWRAFLIPLTFRLLRSADDLAMAAELKGIGGKQAARRKGAAMTRRDGAALGAAILSLAIAVCIQYAGGATRMMG